MIKKIFFSILALINFNTFAKSVTPVKVGDKAPDFALQDETGKVRKLSEFKNGRIVLFFYPKDGSPWCTAQACSIRDNTKEYAKNNITVLGINYDSPKSHKEFKEKHKLPFILLSDSKKEVAELYGAYTGIIDTLAPKRMSILIDNGRVIKILKDVSINGHAEEILQAFGIKAK